MTRLAIVVSHPIQHFVHLYRALAARPGLEIKVFFCSRIGIDRYFDGEMNSEITWDGDLLEGYEHAFLDEAQGIGGVSFGGIDNPSIAEALRTFEPSHVLVYGYAQKTALRALAWARTRRLPVLMIGDGDAAPRRHSLREALRRASLRLLLGQVAAFLTVGDQNESHWLSLGVKRERLHRSPFPIDEDLYCHARANRAVMRAATRRRYDIPDDAIVALFVGKLTARKRPRDLLEAASAASGARRVHVLLCGEGAERAELEALARTAGVQATFAGFVNLEQLPAHYCAADMLVIPSFKDHHPLIGSEACAVGLPLVVSDRVGLVGPTDIARPDDNALVYPCGDTAALGLAIARLSSDPSLVDRMSAASLAIFEQTAMRHAVDGVLRALQHAGPPARPASLTKRLPA